MPASGQRSFSLLFLHQDLDTPYGGSEELPNPDGRRTLQRSLLLRGEIGLGERYALRGLLPVRSIDTEGLFEFEGEGLGDLEFEVMRRLGPEEARGGGAVGVGLSLPTAESAPVDLVDENVFFGAGAASLLVTLEGYRILAPGVTLFGSARYRRPLDEGDEDYLFGEDFGYQGTVAWSPGDGRFGVNVGVSSQHLGRDEQAGIELDNRGGRFQYATLGLRYRLRYGLDLGVASSWLVDQDVRGDQLLARHQATFGLAWSWGEHVHEADEHEHDEPHHDSR